MRLDHGDLIASESELRALCHALELERGPLAVLPAPPGGAADERAAALPEGAADLRGALASLASPTRRIDVRHAFGQESIGRTVLMWSQESRGQMVVLEELGHEHRLGRRSESHVRGRLAAALAPDKEAPVLRRALSTPAVLSLVAFADCLRYAWLVSMIEQARPVRRISAADVHSRFEHAGREDSRWPLNFLDKAWGSPLAEHEAVKDLTAALDELEAAGLLVRVAEGAETAYETVGQGGLLAEILTRDDRKLALTVRSVAHGSPLEVALLVRSPSHLLLAHMRGSEASLRLLGAGELDEWLERLVVGEPVWAEDLVSPACADHTTNLAAIQTLVLNASPAALQLALGKGNDMRLYGLVAETTIGRLDGNTITLADPGVSRTHARIHRDPRGLWLVEDLGTSNGTFVNGRRIEAPTPISPGDTIQVSATTMRVLAPGV